MGKVLFFDCFSGISGDMALGAFLDLGIDEHYFIEELAKLHVEGFRLDIRQSMKKGITGTSFTVILEENLHTHHHRNLYDIEKIIDDSALNPSVKALSKKIFRLVAEAEAKIHGKALEQVHFHEVGAIDSIVDIVGVAICMDFLGMPTVYTSPLQVGSGFVRCAHGMIPVPAPATLEILKGVPIYNHGIQTELVTPTGAAIVKALSSGFGDIPAMEVEKIGYGLGKKDLEIPNMLRICLGEKKKSRIS